MQIQENISLKPFNTFGIGAKARYFSAFSNVGDLAELLAHGPRLTTPDSRLPTLVLGGGSNMLFTKDFNGVILKMR
ncbi:MAG: hypothetical protein WDO71_18260 [Bacteroidota bacterium]